MRDRLEEYLDGLLAPEEAREVEDALARDPALREELERVRRFAGLLEELTPDAHAVRRAVERVRARGERRALLFRISLPLVAAAAAALAVWIATPGRAADDHGTRVLREVEAQWLAFGERLGAIATERREGRVPRTGVGGLEVPPAPAYGIVFKGALDALGVRLDPAVEERALDLVAAHHVGMRRRGRGLAAECDRAAASLALYRELSRVAGADVADAYYDVFRPGLPDLETTERVRPDSLQFVVADHERYREAYRAAVRELERRYGSPSVAVVVERLAPGDRRVLSYDPAFEGVGREAVLAIRVHLYEAARDAGADKLYVEG